ncbi:MAG: discoidin domain-containing protein [Bacteroidales bacterium]
MKTRYKLLGFLAAGLLAFSSCSEDKVIVEIPSDISNLRTTPGSGNIELRWDMPADSNLFYVEVRYKDPKTNEKVRRHVSKYADSLLVKGLLQKYGTIDFEVQSYSMTGGSNQVHSVADAALYAPVDTLYHTTEIVLTTENLTTNAQEPSEGPLTNLIDGKNDTFFHSAWSVTISDPHNLEIDLGTATNAFQYETKNRHNNSNDAPKSAEFFGSNDKETWVKIGEIKSGMPTDKEAAYKSPVLRFDDSYQYIRYVPVSRSGKKWFSLAEFKAYTVKVEIRDPEKD